MFEGVVVYRPERTLLARSGRTVAERIYADLTVVAAARSDETPADQAAPAQAGADAVLPGGDDEPRPRGRRRRARGSKEAKEVS
jgi:hypothetical protein